MHPILGDVSQRDLFKQSQIVPVVMFAMVRRSSTGILRMVCSDPVNSMAWFKTSSLLNKPHKATITSLPVTPGGKIPVKVTLAIGGICHLKRRLGK